METVGRNCVCLLNSLDDWSLLFLFTLDLIDFKNNLNFLSFEMSISFCRVIGQYYVVGVGGDVR